MGSMSLGSILFDLLMSSIGAGYLLYGRKSPDFTFIITGILLMFYSYFVGNLFLSVIVGIILCFVPFILKKYF